jgi:hypothetical protein
VDPFFDLFPALKLEEISVFQVLQYVREPEHILPKGVLRRLDLLGSHPFPSSSPIIAGGSRDLFISVQRKPQILRHLGDFHPIDPRVFDCGKEDVKICLKIFRPVDFIVVFASSI